MSAQIAHRKRVFSLFGYRTGVAAHWFVGVWCVLLALLWGCGQRRAVDNSEALRAYAEQAGAVLSPDAGGGASVVEGWSVLVAVVPTNREEDAEAMLETVRSAGLGGARVAMHNGRRVIVYGSWDDPGAEEAQRGLAAVRGLQIGGVTPFAAAVMIPPAAPAGAKDEFDLRGVKARLGDDAVYTLQVGVYARGDFQKPSEQEIALFRRSAERAVAELRAQGEQAFFYHGPNRSSVTVGVFGEDDHDGSTRPAVESARLRALRERFPHCLLNGEGLMETVQTERGPVKRLQPSYLVAIPKQ
ncbi:MAG: hypothetical protein D6692_10105 [Planctomycetota bacterium]|nr:MAG: hypothetical protein D6692_10105 [Planctomycetota bacterium]